MKSEEMLNDIHPALAEVVRRAQAISDIQIQVIHGKEHRHNKMSSFEKELLKGNLPTFLWFMQ